MREFFSKLFGRRNWDVTVTKRWVRLPKEVSIPDPFKCSVIWFGPFFIRRWCDPSRARMKAIAISK